MINYSGPRAVFAIKNHPKHALDDILYLTGAVARLTAERAVLSQRVADLERELLEARAAHAVESAQHAGVCA